MKTNTAAGHQSPALAGEQLRNRPLRVTARNVVVDGDVETIYRVDGRDVGSLTELRALLRCSR